jgi:glycosyltransferase involved in cell wall biosynthesis
MKIAFLHYHLKTGGVTTVLKRQVSALQGRCEILVLTGDRAGATLPCRIEEIPGIGYDRPDICLPPPKITADRVLKTLFDIWPKGCDVLHVHNPTLAKNKNFLQCIKHLQACGIRLFLQIHDFAEDGRPGVYSRESYPADCHYGVINGRDKRILIDAGLKVSGVHLIPNAIYPLTTGPGFFPEKLVLYPVRAIRRKNIGEAVLLSLYLEQDQYLGITQPPNSQTDIESYQDWRTFVKKNRLKIQFNIGRRYDFAALAGAASSMVTTSIAEGFGFAFLEPWTAGKVLQGRRLGNICTDFEGNGLCLNFLYDQLDVPLEWFDADGFFQGWQRTVKDTAETLGHTVAQESINHFITRRVHDGVMDFGLLNERCQRQVLSHLLSDPAAKKYLTSLNPRIIFADPENDMSEILENNRSVVTEHYGAENCREQLLSIYERVIHDPVHQRVDKKVLLDAFFDLDRFSLLKWGTYDG